MGVKQVPYSICDYPGCHSDYPAEYPKTLEITFGVHPKIVESLGRPVIVQKRTFHYCQRHALHVKELTRAAADFNGGVIGPDFREGLGCWITGRHYTNELVKQFINHQFPYEIFEVMYASFRRKFTC